MKLRAILPALLLIPCLTLARAQSAADAGGQAAAYTKAITGRAEKITASLGLTDAAQAVRVRDLLVRHYRDLAAIDAAEAARLKTARAQAGAGKTAAVKSAEDAATLQRDDLHAAFLGSLLAELTPAQVDQVKDGLTYRVTPLTYRVYTEMLPGLTAAQKRQILAWLLEAREHAMDAGSSGKKHAWFGKYKGRINNYLAHEGYNVKQAERDLIAHEKAAAGKQ